MSDGPFKNLRLAKHWRKLARAACNDAFDQGECCAMASHAIVQDILTSPRQALLLVLKSYVAQSQIEMDPLLSIEKIFNDHGKDQFADVLQKEMAYRLNENFTHKEAFEQALVSSVSEQISISLTRIQEECIHSSEIGEMKQGQFDRTIDRTVAVFESLDRKSIFEAIISCDKQAFKSNIAKKEGIDEGPSL